MTEFRQTTPPDDRDADAQPPRWDEVDWDTWTPGSSSPPPRAGSAPDLAPLLALIDVMRGALPRELRDQWASLVREALLTLRALIDWYLEKLGDGKSPTQVEDIPIE